MNNQTVKVFRSSPNVLHKNFWNHTLCGFFHHVITIVKRKKKNFPIDFWRDICRTPWLKTFSLLTPPPFPSDFEGAANHLLFVAFQWCRTWLLWLLRGGPRWRRLRPQSKRRWSAFETQPDQTFLTSRNSLRDGGWFFYPVYFSCPCLYHFVLFPFKCCLVSSVPVYHYSSACFFFFLIWFTFIFEVYRIRQL